MANPLYGSNAVDDDLNHGGHGVQVVTSDTTLVASNSGDTIVIGANAGITVKLPSPTAGMNFMFMYAGAAAETEDTIIDTQSDTNYLLGGLAIHDTNATGAVALAPILPDGNSNSIMTLKDPSIGTWVKMVSDGTNWYHAGMIQTETATAVVYADQS